MPSLRARLDARLKGLPLDLLFMGLWAVVLFGHVVYFTPRWGVVDATLVALAMLAVGVALATAGLIRLMLNLMVKQVEVFANLLGRGRGGDAKSWAQGKRVR